MNRGFSGGAGSSGISVAARIHELDKTDQTVLDEWDRIKATQSTAMFRHDLAGRADLSRQAEHRQHRVSTVRRALQRERSAHQQRAMHDYQLGRRLEAKGKLAAASVVYQNALKRADERLKTQVVSRMKAMESAKIARASTRKAL